VSESAFETPARKYPVLFGRDVVQGAVVLAYDNTVLLYFPDDFPRGRYFYVFFWTDIHPVSGESGTLDQLKALVDSFEVKASPLGAVSKGCGV
jgi:hypothetical protein